MKKEKLTKLLSIGITTMGFIHIIATFLPVIGAKLSPLSQQMQQSCIYFSLMCGTLLIVGGLLTHLLSDKISEYSFLRTPFLIVLSALAIDGILAVYFMPHNPCAWVILVLTAPLLGLNVRER